MQEPACHERYPALTVVAANGVSLLIYAIGAYILYKAGIAWAIAYVLFIILLEFRLLSGHCTDCYYYGRICAFGKGYVSSLFFKRGSPEQFDKKTATWKDIAPDFLVIIIPVIAGIWLLVREFSASILILVISLFILGFPGNAFVRGQLACRYCRQREIGCPAERMFDKTKK